MFYWLGTDSGAISWTNPHTLGTIVISFNNGAGAPTGAKACDRSAADDNGIQLNSAGNWWKVVIPGWTIRPSATIIRSRPNGSGTASNIAGYKVQGSDDDSNWTDLNTVSGLTYVNEADYQYSPFTPPATFYRYIRLLWQSNVTGANAFFFLTDWEMYGELQQRSYL